MKHTKNFGFALLIMIVVMCLVLAACVDNNVNALESITIYTGNVKTTYVVGDEFSYDKLVVTAHYSDKTTSVVTAGYTVTGYDMSVAGTQTVTVTYKDKTATYQITVSEQHSHSYGVPVWNWTGNNDGYTAVTATFTCTDNDDEQVKTATVTSATTDATCTADGKTVYTATVNFNGQDYTDKKEVTLNALGHTLGAWVNEVPANCTTSGVKGHYYCSTCEKNFAPDGTTELADIVIPVSHTLGEWVTEVPATCTTAGTKGHYCCSVCDKIIDADKTTEITDLTIAALDHDLQDVNEVPATCTEPGTAAGKRCSRCDYTEGFGEIAALGHNYGQPEWTWTGNDDDGYTAASAKFSCTRCTHEQTVTDNDLGVEDTQNNCTKDRVYSASVEFNNETYSATKSVTIDGQHTFTAGWINEVPATCQMEGTKGHYYCTVCEQNFDIDEKVIEDLTIEKLAHELQDVNEVPATCTEPGTTAGKKCANCDYTEGLDEIPANGHTFEEDWIDEVPADCYNEGTKGHYHCTVCEKNFAQDGTTEIEDDDLTIAKTVHNFENGICSNCQGTIDNSYTVDLYSNIIAAWFNTTKLTMEDMRAVQLVIDGEAVDTPYNFETAAEGQFRAMFKDISLLITEEGRHTIAFRFHGKDYVPTAIGLSDYEADTMKYTMSLDNEQLIITAEAKSAEGAITSVGNMHFDYNILGVWIYTTNIDQKDMYNVQLVIDDKVVATPYEVQTNGVAGQYRPMYNNVFSYLTTAGDHVIKLMYNEQYYVPTEVSGGPHTSDDKKTTYTISIKDGQVVINVEIEDSEEPGPGGDAVILTLKHLETYGGEWFRMGTTSSVDLTKTTTLKMNGKSVEFRHVVTGDGYEIHIHVVDVYLETYSFQWLVDDVVIATAVYENPNSGSDVEWPDEPVTLTLEHLETYGDGWFRFGTTSTVNLSLTTTLKLNGNPITEYRYVPNGNYYEIHVRVVDTTLDEYAFQWIVNGDKVVATAVYKPNSSGGGDEPIIPEPGDARTITITGIEVINEVFIRLLVSDDDLNYIKDNASYIKVNKERVTTSWGVPAGSGYLIDYGIQVNIKAGQTEFVFDWYKTTDDGDVLIATATYPTTGGGEDPEPNDGEWALTKASLVAEDGKVYFVYSGTYSDYEEEALKTLLNTELIWDVFIPESWIPAKNQNGFENTKNFVMDYNGEGTWAFRLEITVGSLGGYYGSNVYYFDKANGDRYEGIWQVGENVELNSYKYEFILYSNWTVIAFRISEIITVDPDIDRDNYELRFSTEGSYVANENLVGLWVYYHNIEEGDSANKRANGTYNHGTLVFNFTENKGNWWCTQLFYKNPDFQTDSKHTVKLTLLAEFNGRIRINGNVYTLVSGVAQTVEFEFTQGADATLSIQFGVPDGSIDNESGKITISNIIFDEEIDVPDPTFTTTDVDLVKDDNTNTVYLVIKGTSENYASADALKAALLETYFDLEHNKDAGASGWNGRKTDLTKTATVSENGNWELKIDITNLDKSAYTAHFRGEPNNLVSENRTIDGKYFIVGDKSYIIVNKHGEEGVGSDGSRFWGAIGILVGDTTLLKITGARLVAEDTTVYLVLSAQIIGYDVKDMTVGDKGDLMGIEKDDANGILHNLYINITNRTANGNALWCHLYLNGSPFTGFWDGNIYGGTPMSVTANDKSYSIRCDESTSWILQIIVNAASAKSFSFVRASLEQAGDQVYMVFKVFYLGYSEDDLKSFVYFNNNDKLYIDEGKTLIGDVEAKLYINITNVNADGEWWYGHFSINGEIIDGQNGDVYCDITGENNEAAITIGNTEYKIAHAGWGQFYMVVKNI
ncbi:MAG: bacterial Ig-like domain-containing protein [Clostridiales bacterium]|nr:bacterial Ig-like domain-containing protein [Clostridiales bacterium]